MNRREFLALSAAAALAPALPATAGQYASVPMIDTHIHLFDPARPQGIPWPEKSDKLLYKPALPGRYRQVVASSGVVGAIVVEASPWLEDNQWVLDTAARDHIIVGVIGNLEPEKSGFEKQLARFAENQLFRGVRYGNLWGHDIGAQVQNPRFIAGLASLSKAGLVLDTANPDPALLAAIVRLTDKLPDLKIIIDHLPQMAVPADSALRKVYEESLREIGQRPQIYVKISEVLRKEKDSVPTSLDFYRGNLDKLYGTFGEDRVLYGSDWPNSDQWLPFEAGLNLVRAYFQEKGLAASEKYFWKNSIAAYSWHKRDNSQPG
ncbi:amidohydrolase family protein [Dyadobacter sandarakinus]|uniref:Amidohydrolase n=1 Tax=Dyadobacter sandarakinus TaxID=2747268 RepID=A0ABX7I3S3_9BACT|nr:amidohydrolase family protein [Dyadobacter sandarakinus]QRR00731.1 amidohydrolase [Dyadobacter sandarakinus]